MSQTQPMDIFGNIDIYVFDQILKGRYATGEKILDAGCGGGRNLFWFYHNGYELYAVDKSSEAIADMKVNYPKFQENYHTADLVHLPFEDASMHHIICSAVLHFAESPTHFLEMFTELLRVLRPGGSLFMRIASDVGIENKIIPVGNGVFDLPDGTTRFLLTRSLLYELLQTFPVKMLETFKTTNVSDIRAMSTLVLEKQ